MDVSTLAPYVDATMRLLLLLSALFTALAGTSAGARVAAVPAHQASASIEAVTGRASLATKDRRAVAPVSVIPVERSALTRAFTVVAAIPLYAGRLRV